MQSKEKQKSLNGNRSHVYMTSKKENNFNKIQRLLGWLETGKDIEVDCEKKKKKKNRRARVKENGQENE